MSTSSHAAERRHHRADATSHCAPFVMVSEVDFLVRTEPETRMSFANLIAFQDDLSPLGGRPVDVVLGTGLDASDASPCRKGHVLATMEPVYGARRGLTGGQAAPRSGSAGAHRGDGPCSVA